MTKSVNDFDIHRSEGLLDVSKFQCLMLIIILIAFIKSKNKSYVHQLHKKMIPVSALLL